MGRKNDETLELVREAIEQLRRGDHVEALTTLERCAFPKWNSVEDSYLALFAHQQEAAGKPAVA